jgi:hypothetical protein
MGLGCHPMRAVLLFLSLFIASDATCSAITVIGLKDETVYVDKVTFEVVHEPGFGLQFLINGEGATTSSPITIDEAGFYELVVNKLGPGSSEIVETETVHFIVRSSERGSTEIGLRPWVPRMNIPAADAEIALGSFELIAPRRFPINWPIPVVAKLIDGDRKTLRVVADAQINDQTVRLYRGAGSLHFPAFSTDETHNITIEAASQTATRAVLTSSLPITIAPASIDADTSWTSPGIVQINTDMNVAVGATLSIGPGVIVEIGNAVDFTIDGKLQISGEEANPTVITAAPGSTWGGCIVNGEVDATFLFVTRGGENPVWFNAHPFSAHRKEQATFLLNTGSSGSFEDCYWIENPGQALHGNDATLTLDRCLVQRSPTTGQFNGGRVILRDCHLVEFPIDSPEFAANRNDAIYFKTGDHELHDTVIGWAKDDGVDAGSSESGTVLVDGCWFESCFHEAMAWSGGDRDVIVRNTVALNSGQGIECGFSTTAGSPNVIVSDSIAIGNSIGWRFGDNYDWTYSGLLTVTDSISLYNEKDVWGYEWDSWTYRADAMDIRDNWLTRKNPMHPDNRTWDGSDLTLIEALEPTTAVVGAGFSSSEIQRPLHRYGEEIEFGFSSFGSIPPGLGFTISSKVVGNSEETTIFGGLRAGSGQMLSSYKPTFFPRGGPVEYIRFTLHDGNNGQITTPRNLIYIDTPGVDNVEVVVPLGSEWAYLDDGSDPGPGWIEENFDDSSWKYGPAEFGYGDDDEATKIDDSSANYPSYYFRHEFEPDDLFSDTQATIRLRCDDGAIVYLNGVEVMRSNMRDGPVSHSDFALGLVGDRDEYVSMSIDSSLLIDGDDNILAVEVHQANATSLDVSFDLELKLERSLEPKLFLVPIAESKALIIWTNTGNELLEESTDLVTWTPVPGAASPKKIDYTHEGAWKFYRLRMAP